MFPPALPPSHSHPSHGLLGLCPCLGWGWVGARAGLVLGTDYPPLSPPFPGAFFFGAAPGEGGEKGALRCPDLPRSLPHLSTPGSSTLLARLNTWGREGGGGAGTGAQRPPYHPTYASNPHNAPGPTRTTSGNPEPVTFLSKADWTQGTGGGFGWGRGLGGLSRPLTLPSPPPPQVRPPPRMWGWSVDAVLGRRGIWWG